MPPLSDTDGNRCAEKARDSGMAPPLQSRPFGEATPSRPEEHGTAVQRWSLDPQAIAAALERDIEDDALRRSMIHRGLE